MTQYPTDQFITAQLIALGRDDLLTGAVLVKSMSREQLEDAVQTLALALTRLALREGMKHTVKRVLTDAAGAEVDPW